MWTWHRLTQIEIRLQTKQLLEVTSVSEIFEGFFLFFLSQSLKLYRIIFCSHLKYDIEERSSSWKRICAISTLCMITIKNPRGRCLFVIFRLFSSEIYCVEYQLWCWKSLFLPKFRLPELRIQLFSGLKVEVTQTLPVTLQSVCHFADTTDLVGRKPKLGFK